MAAAVTDVRSMSPAETSHWCSSLALCGVKGKILRDLQEQIQRRQIDGLLFDKMLRSNALQDLGVEELNARLALAIRRSWTTDFAGVSFIDYAGSQGQVFSRTPAAADPEPRRYPASSPSSQFHAQDMGPPSQGHPNQKQQQAAGPDDYRSWPPQRPGFPSDLGVQSVNARAERRSALGLDFGRAAPSAPSQEPYRYGDARAYQAQPDLFGGRPGVPSDQRGAPSDEGHGRHQWSHSPMDQRHMAPMGSDDAFQDARDFRDSRERQAYADRSYQGSIPSPMPGSGFYGQPVEDDFNQRHSDHHGLRPQQSPVSGRFNGKGDCKGDGAWNGSEMSAAPAQGRLQQLQQPQGGRARGKGDGGWDGGSFDEAFAPRGPAPVSYAAEALPRGGRGRGPAAAAQLRQSEEWGGGGLDSALPPRQQMPANVAQPIAEREREREKDRAAQAASFQQQHSQPVQYGQPPAYRGNVPFEVGRDSMEFEHGMAGRDQRREDPSDWGGMAHGDAHGSMRPSIRGDSRSNGEFDSVSQQAPMRSPVERDIPRDEYHDAGFDMPGRRQQSQGFGERDQKDPAPVEDFVAVPRGRGRVAPPADNGWGGQSLGDALAPKKAAAPAAASAGGGSSGSRGGPGARTAAPAAQSATGHDPGKSTEWIVSWVRSLPESHVPERTREGIVQVVEERRLSGREFSEYVQTVPPEVCAPKNAMKLKAAWGNVLKEADAVQVAMANLSNQPKQKATMIVV